MVDFKGHYHIHVTSVEETCVCDIKHSLLSSSAEEVLVSPMCGRLHSAHENKSKYNHVRITVPAAGLAS